MSQETVAHGAASIAQGSSSFAAASRLFSRQLREDVWRFYAWCRHCDDQIDGQDHGGAGESLTAAERLSRLTDLRTKTAAALAGAAVDGPAFAGFQQVALRHRIDARWPQEMLDGFAKDVEPIGFASQADTLSYCWGVAGVVGVMMAKIMGVEDAAVLRRAQDLGLAFQLTNISRDVREDALDGRVYLPADALAALGLDATPQAMLDPSLQARIFVAIQGQLALAEIYYDSARGGLRALPFRAALAVAAARRIYRKIGRLILERGPDALQARTRVPKLKMAGLLVLGVSDALWSRIEKFWPAPPRPALWSRL